MQGRELELSEQAEDIVSGCIYFHGVVFSQRVSYAEMNSLLPSSSNILSCLEGFFFHLLVGVSWKVGAFSGEAERGTNCV